MTTSHKTLHCKHFHFPTKSLVEKMIPATQMAMNTESSDI